MCCSAKRVFDDGTLAFGDFWQVLRRNQQFSPNSLLWGSLMGKLLSGCTLRLDYFYTSPFYLHFGQNSLNEQRRRGQKVEAPREMALGGDHFLTKTNNLKRAQICFPTLVFPISIFPKFHFTKFLRRHQGAMNSWCWQPTRMPKKAPSKEGSNRASQHTPFNNRQGGPHKIIFYWRGCIDFGPHFSLVIDFL